jgi:hypothetical protein
VDGEAQALVHHCGGAIGAEQISGLGERDGLGDLAQGVVVAADHEAADAGVPQTAQLMGEEEPGVEVLPVAVEDVPGDQDQVRLPLQGQVHQVDEGAAGGVAQVLGRGPLVALQAPQWAVEV